MSHGFNVHLSRPSNDWDPTWAARLVRDLEQVLNNLGAPKSTGWVVTNPTTNKSVDVSAITHAELAQVVGTLITVLQEAGLLAK